MIPASVTTRLAALLLLLASSAVLAPVAQARYSALVVDPNSGAVLFERNANEYRHPASLTKMMTLYMVFDALARGRLGLGQWLVASEYAASRPPTKLGLRPGDPLSVEQGIYALVTLSANDAATVFAESLGGSEYGFAQQMTQKARMLGMTQTVFRNASGLPDPEQITTAWDMYRLAYALRRDFPQYYRYFAATDFYFHNRVYRNHNHLLYNYEGTDGIKTGYIRESGFNLVASASRSGHRLIGVVFGGNSPGARDAHMRTILDQGFAKLEGRWSVSPVFASESTESPFGYSAPREAEEVDSSPPPRAIRRTFSTSARTAHIGRASTTRSVKHTRSTRTAQHGRAGRSTQSVAKAKSTTKARTAQRTQPASAGKSNRSVAKAKVAAPAKSATAAKPVKQAKLEAQSKSTKRSNR